MGCSRVTIAHVAPSNGKACFVLGPSVIEVRSYEVRLSSGRSAAGGRRALGDGGPASRLIAEGGLPHDQRGALLVDENLRSSNGAPVWAAGDCAALSAPLASDAEDGDAQGRQLSTRCGPR